MALSVLGPHTGITMEEAPPMSAADGPLLLIRSGTEMLVKTRRTKARFCRPFVMLPGAMPSLQPRAIRY